MGIERIPNSLLKGEFLHCQPVNGGPIIKAQIIPFEGESTPTFKVAIICPARRPSSKCELRIRAGSVDDYCQYYKGDSRGEYQIVGPGMDKKIRRGLEIMIGVNFNSLQGLSSLM